MSDFIGGETSGIEKAMPIVCGVILVAAIISIPFMQRDNEKIRQQKWQSQGCKMYDSEFLKDVPVKCLNEFVDHYKAQEQRIQPSDNKETIQ